MAPNHQWDGHKERVRQAVIAILKETPELGSKGVERELKALGIPCSSPKARIEYMRVRRRL